MLTIALDMQIEESVSKHKREISEAFVKLRAMLLPEPKVMLSSKFSFNYRPSAAGVLS